MAAGAVDGLDISFCRNVSRLQPMSAPATGAGCARYWYDWYCDGGRMYG